MNDRKLYQDVSITDYDSNNRESQAKTGCGGGKSYHKTTQKINRKVNKALRNKKLREEIGEQIYRIYFYMIDHTKEEKEKGYYIKFPQVHLTKKEAITSFFKMIGREDIYDLCIMRGYSKVLFIKDDDVEGEANLIDLLIKLANGENISD